MLTRSKSSAPSRHSRPCLRTAPLAQRAACIPCWLPSCRTRPASTVGTFIFIILVYLSALQIELGNFQDISLNTNWQQFRHENFSFKLKSDAYLKGNKYRCKQCDGRQANSDRHSCCCCYGERRRVVVICPAVVCFGDCQVGRKFCPRYSSLTSRRAVPAATCEREKCIFSIYTDCNSNKIKKKVGLKWITSLLIRNRQKNWKKKLDMKVIKICRKSKTVSIVTGFSFFSSKNQLTNFLIIKF